VNLPDSIAKRINYYQPLKSSILVRHLLSIIRSERDHLRLVIWVTFRCFLWFPNHGFFMINVSLPSLCQVREQLENFDSITFVPTAGDVVQMIWLIVANCIGMGAVSNCLAVVVAFY